MVILKTPLRAGKPARLWRWRKWICPGWVNFTRLLSGSEDNLKIFDAIYQDGMRPDEWKDAS
jgi:type IV secretion system protein VirB4